MGQHHPEKYQPGQLVKGAVTKITNFGVFIGLEDGLEGLLHISELADHKIENPEEVVKVGDEIEVKVLRVDIDDERKIGLSRKRVDWAAEQKKLLQRLKPKKLPRKPSKRSLSKNSRVVSVPKDHSSAQPRLRTSNPTQHQVSG